MKHTFIELTEDEFIQQYPLLTNHLNANASWAYGDGPGCLFETFGPELAFVRQQDPRTIWTLVDGDDGDQYVVSGYHLVNRIGYFISTVPVPDDRDFQVRIPMEAADDEARIDQPDCLFSKIASEHLGIPTLETRRSDSLDFHNVAVWSVKEALRAAYQAGVVSVSQNQARPRVTISIRGGSIEDLHASMPVTAVVEDWDVPDEVSGTRPSRRVYELGTPL